MKKINIYRVIEPETGTVIIAGTVGECARALKLPKDKFWVAAGRGTPITCSLTVEAVDPGDAGRPELVQENQYDRWDKFAARARAFYGVPVRHFGDDLYKAPKRPENGEQNRNIHFLTGNKKNDELREEWIQKPYENEGTL